MRKEIREKILKYGNISILEQKNVQKSSVSDQHRVNVSCERLV